MTSNSLRIVPIFAIVLSLAAFAQTAPAPAAASPAPASATAAPSGKIGVVYFEAAVSSCNEGQRDFQALQKKFEPKSNEFAGQAKEVDDLKKELSTKGSMLNDQARGELERKIDSKQKALQRSYEDVQNDFQAQKGELGNRIAQKMVEVLKKYATDNGFSVILDYGEGLPVIWHADQIDITKELIVAYNQQSGVAPPMATGAPAPAMPKSGTGTAKPGTTTPTAKPGTTTPATR